MSRPPTRIWRKSRRKISYIRPACAKNRPLAAILMRYLILYFPLSQQPLYGQTRVFNLDLADSTEQRIFQFVRNVFRIESKQHIDSFRFSNPGSSMYSIGNNLFHVYVYHSGTDTLTLYSNGKILLKSIFRVDTLTQPIVRIGESLDTVLSVSQILLNPYLKVNFPNTGYKGHFFIQNFMMEIKNETGDMLLSTLGDFNRFSAEQLKGIKRLTAGDRLFFPYIVGGGPDSRLRKFQPFTVIIK